MNEDSRERDVELPTVCRHRGFGRWRRFRRFRGSSLLLWLGAWESKYGLSEWWAELTVIGRTASFGSHLDRCRWWGFVFGLDQIQITRRAVDTR